MWITQFRFHQFYPRIDFNGLAFGKKVQLDLIAYLTLPRKLINLLFILTPASEAKLEALSEAFRQNISKLDFWREASPRSF